MAVERGSRSWNLQIIERGEIKMSTYYIDGLPCSDELYHHGVRGQKWGVRRYQYEDRTLTPLGKAHYAAMKVGKIAGDTAKRAGSAVKSGAKKAINRQVMNIKKKHPWMMTNEELEAFTKRLNLENSYKEAMSKANKKTVSKGREFAGEVTREIGKRLTLSAIDRLNTQLSFRQKQNNADKEKTRARDRDLDDRKKRALYSPVDSFRETARQQWKLSKRLPTKKELDEMNEYMDSLNSIFGDFNTANSGKKKKNNNNNNNNNK